MHENTNLLNTLASSVGDFARKNMRIVFTEEELKAQVLPPARSHLKRESLDEHRFQLVNGMCKHLCMCTFWNAERLFHSRSCPCEI